MESYGDEGILAGNQTKVTEFILLGFGDIQKVWLPLSLVFMVTYIMTITGNILILALVVSDQQLQTPMYFFLGNLSFLEACSSSNILPRILYDLWTGDRSISFSGCFTQWYLCASFLVIECCLLCAMSYDRYLAICKPLHYTSIMNTQTCIQLAAASWINGFSVILIALLLMLQQFSFCDGNEIDHYFCDFFPLKKLSCNFATLLIIVCYAIASTDFFLPFLLILTSYVFIIVTIMKIPSSTERKKAFSTCSSHLVVVSLFYGSLTIIYLLPKTEETHRTDKFSSLLYTVLPPLANPFIYSLRNKDVIKALKIILVKLQQSK